MISWLRPLGIPLWFILAVILVILLTRRTSAATVETGTVNTGFTVTSVPPRVTSISQSTTVTLDLSDLGGLIPGSDIDVQFTTASEIEWLGSFGANDGALTLQFQARLALTIGSFSTFQDTTWSVGPADFMNPGGPITGYTYSPVPSSFTLTVPWGTDLSEVDLTLTDFFSLTGSDPFILDSSLKLPAATLTTTSAVPEPGVFAMSAFAALTLFRRRSAGRSFSPQ